MNNKSNSIDFSQYVAVPYVGEAWATRDAVRPSWLPFFHLDTRYVGDTPSSEGQWVDGPGAIRCVTLRAGRWYITLDRPRAYEPTDAERIMAALSDKPLGLSFPVTWNQTAWLTVAAPLLTIIAIPTMLVTGLFSHLIGSRLRRQLSWR